jgi:hypothetical protein
MTIDPNARNKKRKFFHRLFGWDSPKAVAIVHLVFEWLETVSLALAIGLEISGVRLPANVCWVILAISDIFRHIYGLRDKRLTDEASMNLQGEIDRLTRAGADTALLLTDRAITDDLGFIEAMRVFAGTKVYVAALREYSLDPEAGDLASVIGRILIDAGWQKSVPRPDPIPIAPSAEEGVHIEYSARDWYAPEPSPHVPAGCALADWLNNDNIATAIKTIPNRPKDGVVVVSVGSKPKTLGMANELRSQGNWKRRREAANSPRWSIGPKGVEEIRDLLNQIGEGEAAFLMFMGVARVEDIWHGDFPKAISSLRTKLLYKREQ